VECEAQLVVEQESRGCVVRFHGLNYSAQFNCAQYVCFYAVDKGNQSPGD